MDNEQFINIIASYVLTYANKYGIKVCSPIIAQAILESGFGNSELGKNANNFFGLKYKIGRCPTASGIYYKVGSEQSADGTYVSSPMQWCKFDNMEKCVIGYFDFINNTRYSNLKGVTNPNTYLKNISKDGYATSLNYVKNVSRVIELEDLTKYDNMGGINLNYNFLVALDDGHGMTTAGKRTPKIVELNNKVIHENEFNKEVVTYLNEALIRCKINTLLVAPTDDDTLLSQRVKLANSAKANIYVSIHYNALDGEFNGNDPSGLSIFHYPNSTNGKKLAETIHKYMTNGTKQVDRGVKTANFYVLKYTKMPSVLSENGFMDNRSEAMLMLNVNFQKEVAEEHCQGICEYFNVPYIKSGNIPNVTTPIIETPKSNVLYAVQVGAYGVKQNAENMLDKLKDKGFDGFITTK